jgi:hypothetical protein
MMRTILGSALAVALLAGTVRAEEAKLFGNSNYYADANTPTDGTCPGAEGHGHLGGAHGGGLHRLGQRHGERTVGFPQFSNHDIPPHARDWKGPGPGCRNCSLGECQYRFYGQPDLFANYYAWPACSGLGSELYVSPRPVPPHVGLTYITYQPLMPHEFLYEHQRTYHRYYNGGQGLNRTHVHYRASLFGH